MKKNKLLFIIIFMAFMCTGCGNSEMTRDLRHSGFTMDKEPFNCEALSPQRDKQYERIRYLGSNYVITMNGVIHEISFDQKFSNGKQCMRAKTDLTVEAIIGDTVFRAKDNKIYYFRSSNNGEAYKVVPYSDSNYYVYKFFLLDVPDVVKVQSVGNSTYYVLKNNGTVYSYVVQNNRGQIQVLSTNTVYTSENLGSKIIDFNYAGDQSEATFVRTEDKIFRNEAINRKECNEFIDIVCEYEFAEDATLTKYYDRIIAYNGTMIITDYLKVFRSGGEVKEDD